MKAVRRHLPMFNRNERVDNLRHVGKVVEAGSTRWTIANVERQGMTETYILTSDDGRVAFVPADELRPAIDAAEAARTDGGSDAG